MGRTAMPHAPGSRSTMLHEPMRHAPPHASAHDMVREAMKLIGQHHAGGGLKHAMKHLNATVNALAKGPASYEPAQRHEPIREAPNPDLSWPSPAETLRPDVSAPPLGRGGEALPERHGAKSLTMPPGRGLGRAHRTAESAGVGLRPTLPPPEPPRCADVARAMCRSSAPSAPSTRRVAVVAPGAGTFANGEAYGRLARAAGMEVQLVGRSGASYDRYPEVWEGGAPRPNLESFSQELIRQGLVDTCDCLVFGSRGGQVVLPSLWKALGDLVPPSVVINGGCAGRLPSEVRWPSSAVTLMLLGGQDYFRGNASMESYLAETTRCVPTGNRRSAVLYVNEMGHMPHGKLLSTVLPLLIRAATRWRASACTPYKEFQALLDGLRQTSFTGRLLFTREDGGWDDIKFGIN